MIQIHDGSIILYESNEREFETQGLGRLVDVTSATTTEELNGIYEVEFEYPIDGSHFDDIALRNIIFAETNPYYGRQPFRIYSISRPIGGIVTVNAQHISYDLSDCPVKPFKIDNLTDPNQIWSIIEESWSLFMGEAIPFSFETNLTLSVAKTLEITDITTCRALLSGSDNTMQKIFDGEFEYGYDLENGKFLIQFHDKRGNVPREGDDESVTFPEIRYGKNLTDLKQEENCSNVCTHVFPYYKDGDNLITVADILVPAFEDGFDPGYKKILNVDMNSYFEAAPSQDALLLKTKEHIQNENLGKPKVNLTVSFLYLPDSEEFREVATLEHVNLGDFVYVKFPKLGVQSSSRVIKTVYNIVTKKYNSIDLGESPTASLATIIASVDQDIANVSTSSHKSKIQMALEEATSFIMGNRGGHVIIAGMDELGNIVPCPPAKPSVILISDTEDLDDANDVWMWNKNGLAHISHYSENPQSSVAITQDGKISADFITTGTLDATQAHIVNIDAGTMITGQLSADHVDINTTGSNYIKNSAGLNSVSRENQYVPYWDNSTSDNSCALNTDPAPSSLYLSTVSQSYIKKIAGTDYIEQTIKTIVNEDYMLTGLLSGTKIEVYYDTESEAPYALIDGTDISGSWAKKSVYMPSYPYDTMILRVYATSASDGYVSDIMLAQGDVNSNWTQAPNETYGTYVNIDDNGIEVARAGTDVKTRINNEEFSVYYGDEERVSVNGDETFLDRTNIRNRFIVSQQQKDNDGNITYAARMSFVPTDYGMAIHITSVKTDE